MPAVASALHMDARAPVNLTPISRRERELHYLRGDARRALLAVRDSVLQHNRKGRPPDRRDGAGNDIWMTCVDAPVAVASRGRARRSRRAVSPDEIDQALAILSEVLA